MSGRQLSIRKLVLICTLAAVAGFSAPMMAVAAETAAPARADEAKAAGAGMAPRNTPFRTINRAEANSVAPPEAPVSPVAGAGASEKPATAPPETLPVVPAVKSPGGDERAAADVTHKPAQAEAGMRPASEPLKEAADKAPTPAASVKAEQSGTAAPPAATTAATPVKVDANATPQTAKSDPAPAGGEPVKAVSKPDEASSAAAGAANDKQGGRVAAPAAPASSETTKAPADVAGQPNRAAASSKQNWMGTSTTLATDWAAKSKVVIDKERAAAAARDQGSLDMGIPDDHPMVKDLLAGHKAEEVTLCVAGCGSEPKVVDEVTFPAGDGVAVAAEDGSVNAKAPISSDVMCVAGCGLSKMGVVYRNPRL